MTSALKLNLCMKVTGYRVLYYSSISDIYTSNFFYAACICTNAGDLSGWLAQLTLWMGQDYFAYNLK